MSLDQIVEEAAQLPKEVLGELMERILIKSHGGIDSEVENAWKLEIGHRISDITHGRVQGIPLEESLVRAASKISR